ncbi:hypothetical protein DN069_04535 [Streptacidiphilus pinicola]|uniref:DUF1876 domain-containing protein n=1 Tax=Streptacidiphilus pinicola TaxID=2219663 RepID=A0A2X0JGM5_9ACTN|nr:dsRBD fold-containing protein [Streptacidiphilus pinicola]RAG86808.1 hypothetical protein DN069_04535 [Streptacidiphilus pinicola]
MTSASTPASIKAERWNLSIDVFEEGDETKAHAVMETPGRTLEGRGSAHRNPHDTSVPEIGDEFAAGLRRGRRGGPRGDRPVPPHSLRRRHGRAAPDPVADGAAGRAFDTLMRVANRLPR